MLNSMEANQTRQLLDIDHSRIQFHGILIGTEIFSIKILPFLGDTSSMTILRSKNDEKV